MAKKMGNYKFQNPYNLAMMAARGMSRLPFTNWIMEEPKPKDLVVPTFKQFDGKVDLINHIFLLLIENGTWNEEWSDTL